MWVEVQVKHLLLQTSKNYANCTVQCFQLTNFTRKRQNKFMVQWDTLLDTHAKYISKDKYHEQTKLAITSYMKLIYSESNTTLFLKQTYDLCAWFWCITRCNITTETNVNWTELNWTKLNWTELNWTELNWTELNWTELNWTELNWTELNWTELNWTELNWTELNWTELNWTELNWTELNWTELNWNLLTTCIHKNYKYACKVLKYVHIICKCPKRTCKGFYNIIDVVV